MMEKKKNSEHGNPAIMVAAVLFVATGVAVYRYITNLKKEIYIARWKDYDECGI